MEDRRLRFKVMSLAKPSLPSVDIPLLGPRLYGSRRASKFAVALLFGINSAIGSGEEEIVVVDNPCACA
ncbi:hypothetical protein H6P81_002975 [Aristolochia fimbriata]|uniref:Uncharacterized protein n=1 Tax=Aristolochia fimbriata TaxID=158543 RepID=A0AAV7FB92_ARIFI|nr:hypothetical protein H6P81_002975 [Aristolochia fimbriata]